MIIKIQRIFSDKLKHHSSGIDFRRKEDVIESKEPEDNQLEKHNIKEPLYKRSQEEARFENKDEKIKGRPSIVYNGNSYTKKRKHL